MYAESTQMNVEYLTGNDEHYSNWAKFYVKGLEKWAVREKDDEPESDKHASYSFYVCLDIPEGTIFTVFEQDGDKYGTDTFNFYICEAVPEIGRIEGAYNRYCSGNFRIICHGAGKTKAPRLMDWWQLVGGDRSNDYKYHYALHCAEHINKRGRKECPPFEYEEPVVNVYEEEEKENEPVKIYSHKLTNKEKREAVINELENYPEESNRAIADRLNVSHTYVGKVRRKLTAEGKLSKVSQRKDKNGNWVDVSSLIIEKPSQKIENVNVYELVKNELSLLSPEEIIEFREKVSKLIKEELQSRKDRTLENAILTLAGKCDGANAEDGKGFNKVDAGFGHWLANQIIEGKELTLFIAEKAYNMVQKYHRQIEPVTDWKAIAHQYYQTQNFEELKKKFEENERQIIVTRGQIAVSFPYDAELVRLVKSVEPRGKFNGEDKNWYFHHSACKSLQETFEDEGFCIDENLQALIELENAKEIEKEEEILRKAENTLNLLNSIDLDKPLSNGWSLFEHQKEGIKWLLSHNKEGLLRGGILADHMGLGKTIQTLIAAKELSARNANCPVLVVCPASLRENWAREASIIEVTIETFSWAKLPTPLENSKYILVADEAHYAQNLKSKRTQRLLELAESKNCLASWLLTGTPLKNGRPVNLFPLLLACNHHLSESKSQYEKYYCNAHNNGWGWDVSGASHLDELAKKTEDVILRRTKKECLDLPEKIRSYREVLLEGKEKKAYQAEIDEFINDYRRRVEAGEVDENAEALVTLNILRKVGSKYKVPATIEVAEELLEQNQQIVIFTEFREAAIQIAEQLKGELLLGDTKQEERQNIVDRFQSGESKVFVGSIKAGGVGITLTASSHVILHDRPWTPGDAEQAEDRCHRIGQGNTVNAYWQQLGIIDHSIDSLLTQKQQRIELVLKGKRKTLKGITSPKELAKQLLSIL